MLGQQPRGFQRLESAAVQPRGLEPKAQRQRAPLCALRQFFQPRQRGRRIAVFQRPARGAQLHALAGFRADRPALVDSILQRLLQMGIAALLVLQRLGPLGGEQVGEDPHLPRLRQRGVELGQGVLLRQRGQRGLARPGEPPGEQLGKGVQQRRVQRPLFLLHAPLTRLVRQRKQRRQGPQRDMQADEQGQQEQQHQVEREVHPPGGPEHGDGPLVVAGKQRNRGSNAEQRQEPERGAHVSGRRRRSPEPSAFRRCVVFRPF